MDCRNPSHFDNGSPPWVECYAPFWPLPSYRLDLDLAPLQAEAGQRAKCEPEKSAKTHRIENEW
jgi:hypothetical protein